MKCVQCGIFGYKDKTCPKLQPVKAWVPKVVEKKNKDPTINTMGNVHQQRFEIGEATRVEEKKVKKKNETSPCKVATRPDKSGSANRFAILEPIDEKNRVGDHGF